MRFLDLIEMLFNWLVAQSQRSSQGDGLDEEAALSGRQVANWSLECRRMRAQGSKACGKRRSR